MVQLSQENTRRGRSALCRKVPGGTCCRARPDGQNLSSSRVRLYLPVRCSHFLSITRAHFHIWSGTPMIRSIRIPLMFCTRGAVYSRRFEPRRDFLGCLNSPISAVARDDCETKYVPARSGSSEVTATTCPLPPPRRALNADEDATATDRIPANMLAGALQVTPRMTSTCSSALRSIGDRFASGFLARHCFREESTALPPA